MSKNPPFSKTSWWIADSAEACRVIETGTNTAGVIYRYTLTYIHAKHGHLFNQLATPVTLFQGWQSGSNIHACKLVYFEQLYTSLPHDDPVASSTSVIQEAFSVR